MAIHSLVIVWLPVQMSPTISSLNVTMASPQLSVAVKIGASGILSPSTVVLVGKASTKVGGVVS